MNVHKVDRGTGGMEIERKSDEIGTRKEEKAREETRRRNDAL